MLNSINLIPIQSESNNYSPNITYNNNNNNNKDEISESINNNNNNSPNSKMRK